MLVISVWSITVEAKTIIPQDTVYGIVVDQNRTPIPGAKVEVEGQSVFAYTDIDGRFRILCSPYAKRVIVSFPKMPEIRKKIKPGMEVRLERLSMSNRYEWFVGANVGILLLSAKKDISHESGSHFQPLYTNDNYKGMDFSIMGGQVKDMGWYAKYQLSATGQYKVHGPSAGGVFRLGSPVYLSFGGGVSMTELKAPQYSQFDFPKFSGIVDLGLMVKVKDDIALNWSGSLWLPTSCTDTGFTFAFGVSYFFHK